jgi:small-conductance mechanosensitive channel
MVKLAGLVDSFKRFTILLTFLIILGFSTIYIYDLFVAATINLPTFLTQVFRIILILGFGLTIILLLRQAKPFMTKRIGNQAATILQFSIGAISVLVMSFGVLHTIGVSPETLLTSAGILSITMGLIISTFVGGILAGALVFTTHRFKVGDTVLVNNIPGKVLDITALVTVIRTDVGQMSIPNSAIASGTVIITAIHKFEAKSESRLPYSIGDRVVTTYMNGEGIVKELTPLHTTILLDSGKELTFLNNSILAGTVAIAKITQTQKTPIQTTEKPEE